MRSISSLFAKPCIITWQPLTMIDISEEAALKLYKLFELLGDDEDIQNIYSNLNATES